MLKFIIILEFMHASMKLNKCLFLISVDYDCGTAFSIPRSLFVIKSKCLVLVMAFKISSLVISL